VTPPWDNIGPLVAVAAFALNFIGTLVAGIWKLSRLEVSLNAAIDASGKEIDERIERQSREFGEVASALRAKITDVELYVRDTYVRRDSFTQFAEQLTKQVDGFNMRVEQRLERMEQKIDAKP
jgi:hypothetical protein